MSDNIVWYAPEIFMVAVFVILVGLVARATMVAKRRRHDNAEFECIEEIS